MAIRELKVFISSPSDVRPERLVAQQVVDRLSREFAYHFRIVPVLWEREPLIATEHFQTMIIPPAETDIVVCILWSKLGSPLPAEKFQRLDGSTGVTGTEWEFENAVHSYRTRRTPDLLVYRKRARIATYLDDESALDEQRRQKRQLDEFWQHWFVDASEGSIKAAYHQFETADEFDDKLETHLRVLVEDKLRAEGTVADARAGIQWHQGSPFRGLESFELQHAAVFFGRTRARNELREALARRDPARLGFLLVFGASGSGKSSLVKAGLLSDLLLPGMIGRVALCRHATWRPSAAGDGLFDSLAAALLAPSALPELARLSWDRPALAKLLSDRPELAAPPIGQALKNAGSVAQLTEQAEARLVLVIDQLEELFTVERIGAAERKALAALIGALARSGFVWVIATMRSDFYDRLEALPELVALAEGDGQYHLLPPEPAEIGQIISRPAREAGLRFEVDPQSGLSLDAELDQAAIKDRGSLPLLEFTLEELWQRRTSDGLLTFGAYRGLGGLEGALAKRAEEVYSGLAPDIQTALPAIVRALVTVGDGDAAAARAAPLAALSALPARKTLVEAFAAARLLILDRAEGTEGGATVRVAHEALLRHWPRVRDQIDKDRVDLAVRARAEAAARRYAASGEDKSLLLPAGLPLSEAQDLLDRRRDELDAKVVAYVEASIAAHRQQLEAERERLQREADLARQSEAAARRLARRTRVAAAVFLGLAVIAGGVGYVAYQNSIEANRQRQIAEAEQREAQRQRGLAESSANQAAANARQAEANARQAEENAGRAAENARQADENARQAQAKRDEVLRNQSLYLVGAAQGPALSAREGLPLMLILEALPRDLKTPERPFVPEAFAAAYDSVQKFQQPLGLRGHQGWITGVVFSPDGRFVLTGARDNMARLWDVATRNVVSTYSDHRDEVLAVAMTQDGQRVATASKDGTAKIWDAATARVLTTLRGHQGAVTHVTFSADGRLVLTAGADHTVGIWLTEAGVSIVRIGGHEGAIRVAQFSPGGRQVLTVAEDGMARLFDAGNGTPLFTWREGSVRHAAFTPDGRYVATASRDRRARLWNIETGALATSYVGHEGSVDYVAFSADGKILATASNDKTARLWNVETAAATAILRGHEAAALTVTFSADGHLIATTADDARTRLWTADGKLLADLRESGARRAALSPDGHRVATWAETPSVRLWSTFYSDDERQAFLDVAQLIGIFIRKPLTPEERRSYFAGDPTGSAPPPAAIDPCDTLAGHPYDPGRVGKGVIIELVREEPAEQACKAAIVRQPEPRFFFQLGRAMERRGADDTAADAYRHAAGTGYGAAMRSLAMLLGKSQDEARRTEAADWRKRAAEAGDPLAQWDLGRAALETENSPAAARAWFERAVGRGLPHAALALGTIYDRGQGVERDPATALYYYALAARLWRDHGLPDDGAAAAQRGVPLISQLPVTKVAEIARRVEAWSRSAAK